MDSIFRRYLCTTTAGAGVEPPAASLHSADLYSLLALGPSLILERGDVFVLKTYFINHLSATVNYREQSLIGLNAVYVFDTALFRYPGVGGWENATFFDYLLYLFVLPYWRIGLGRREV